LDVAEQILLASIDPVAIAITESLLAGKAGSARRGTPPRCSEVLQ